MKSNSENHQNVGLFSHRFFFGFPYFSVSIFASIFSSIFDGKWLPKWLPKCMQIGLSRLFLREAPSLFSSYAFWSPVGSPLAPFWHPLAAFWLPLAPFWLPLAPFWLTLAPFWLTFGALWLTLAHPGSPFSHFCCILASFLVFFHILLENIMQNHIFKEFSPKITFSINQIVFS